MQHHQNPPYDTAKLYRQMKNVIQKSIKNEVLKSKSHVNGPISITINVHVHGTMCPARRRFTYRHSRPKVFLKGSNITEKDETSNTAPCPSCPELLSDTNVFNAKTNLMSPQFNSMLQPSNNTLPPKDEMLSL